MKRNWELRRISLCTIRVKAWLLNFISRGYFSLIKNIYTEFCYWSSFSVVLPDLIIKKGGNSFLFNLA